MTLTTLAFLIILITLPASYAAVKAIDLTFIATCSSKSRHVATSKE